MATIQEVFDKSDFRSEHSWSSQSKYLAVACSLAALAGSVFLGLGLANLIKGGLLGSLAWSTGMIPAGGVVITVALAGLAYIKVRESRAAASQHEEEECSKRCFADLLNEIEKKQPDPLPFGSLSAPLNQDIERAHQLYVSAYEFYFQVLKEHRTNKFPWFVNDVFDSAHRVLGIAYAMGRLTLVEMSKSPEFSGKSYSEVFSDSTSYHHFTLSLFPYLYHRIRAAEYYSQVEESNVLPQEIPEEYARSFYRQKSRMNAHYGMRMFYNDYCERIRSSFDIKPGLFEKDKDLSFVCSPESYLNKETKNDQFK